MEYPQIADVCVALLDANIEGMALMQKFQTTDGVQCYHIRTWKDNARPGITNEWIIIESPNATRTSVSTLVYTFDINARDCVKSLLPNICVTTLVNLLLDLNPKKSLEASRPIDSGESK